MTVVSERWTSGSTALLPFTWRTEGKLDDHAVSMGTVLARRCHVTVEWHYNDTVDSTFLSLIPVSESDHSQDHLLKALAEVFSFNSHPKDA